MKSEQDDSWWDKSLRDTAPYVGLGLQLAAAVLLFILVGWWIDSAYDTRPYGILIGCAVGIVGGLLNFIRTVTSPEFGKDETHDDEPD